MRVRLSRLRFSQSSASPWFSCGRTVEALVKRLIADPDFFNNICHRVPLRVVLVCSFLVSLDNRRLASYIIASRFLEIDPVIPVIFLRRSRLRLRMSLRKVSYFISSGRKGSWIRFSQPVPPASTRGSAITIVFVLSWQLC